MAGQIQLGKGQSLDDALLAGALEDLSAEEISRRLNGAMRPERIILRLKELLGASDFLDDTMRERALLRVLQKRVTELQAASDLDSIKVQGAFVKELLAQINKRKNTVDDALGRLYQSQARIMAEAIAIAFERAILELQKRYPNIESTEAREVLSEALPLAVAVISEHNVGEAITA